MVNFLEHVNEESGCHTLDHTYHITSMFLFNSIYILHFNIIVTRCPANMRCTILPHTHVKSSIIQ